MQLNRLLVLGFIPLIVCSACRTIKDRPLSTLLEPKVERTTDFTNIDSVSLYATDKYRGGLFKQIFQGRNFRKAWELPIKVPVVYLDTVDGGLTPQERGGGNQTLSMDLASPSGSIYTLRSVNKDPSELVPKWAEKLNIGNIVTDAISAQHPYGALAAGALADATGVLHSNPRLVFIPHQAALDSFDADYGGRLYLLEYEPEGNGAWVPRPNVQKIVDTEQVQQLLVQHSDAYVSESALLRARLLDIVMGDWDRHAKQWGWLVMKEGDTYKFEPMANDRDNVFYNVGGIIPWIITRPFITPFLRPHRKNIDNYKGLVKDFDRYFLLDAPEEAFQMAARQLQQELTDEVITNAFKVWPDNFYQKDGKKIVRRIKARRDKLPRIARKFRKAIHKKGSLKEPMKGSDKLYERPNKVAR